MQEPNVQSYKKMSDIDNLKISNIERPYFGLNEIDEAWDEVRINEKTTVFYIGSTITKVIHKEIVRNNDFIKWVLYLEFDTLIETEDRKMIVPKTSQGKLKKITSTNIVSPLPTGCIFSASIGGGVHNSFIFSGNHRNNQKLPIFDFEWIKNIDDFHRFINEYISTCPQNYFEKVDRIRNMNHQTVRFGAGDIFRIELDREYYGYGLILGKIREFEKWRELPKKHPLRNVMMQPIMFRFYKIKTQNPNLMSSDLAKIDLLPVDIAGDNDIIWGTHPIVDTKILVESDIDFKMHYHPEIRQGDEMKYRFAWGFGMIEVALQQVPEELRFRILDRKDFSNISVAMSILEISLQKALNGESPYHSHDDLLHPDNLDIKMKIFKMLGIDEDISLDEFNSMYNGLTRKQYIDRIYHRNSN
jgi:hypothetical protein